VRAAARSLVVDGFLLAEAVDSVVDRGARQWD
jgi:hypothetical protein